MALLETTDRYDGTIRVALCFFTLLTDCFSMSSPGNPRKKAPQIVKISKPSTQEFSQGERLDMDLNNSH